MQKQILNKWKLKINNELNSAGSAISITNFTNCNDNKILIYIIVARF